MADPLSIASSIVGLTGFALQASKVLYQTINNFRSSKRSARELRDEVESLSQVLETLEQVAIEYESELSALKLPLIRCGIACKELSDAIGRCVKHSEGQRSSFRDWTRLQYLGDDITAFRHVLANYKATISIALGGATFRTVAVTTQALHEYKDMISNTTSDLQDRLEDIEDKLKSLSSQEKATVLEQMEEERKSTEHCISICAQVSEYIQQSQTRLKEPGGQMATASRESTVVTGSEQTIAKRMADASLHDCLQKITLTSSQLQEHLVRLKNSVGTQETQKNSNAVVHDVQQIIEEKKGIKQCLEICAEASSRTEVPRVNVFEDVTSLDDSQQMLISTVGDLLNAKKISTGRRSLQILGQVSSDSLYQLSLNHVGSQQSVASQREEDNDRFQIHYGPGQPLQHDQSTQKPVR
ncbi:hypothetical protein ASPSYDRAFT_165353 [Aspergillus sydowii CBS 593.65]|uniref:Azaphilone pigments biosynthesis cluster protein L N-terminal domain-containing protein n=1 Tax=Aspergillus sydowii CBS 593.65 TaxID=1036612 RepID=A0A1L9SY97_9EURO|nr:uncharacterized protein ASPSYDRAFT_165353 [Aspergillus sydowii CBS 593.65]OJJ52003.1 hypothetical protein ASPSYDRAFT_165353 [Aspergillus sydowii CBS 593.65]